MKNNMKFFYLLLIILLGVSLRIFAGYNKQYYHTDDIFSFEIINDNSWAEERIDEDNWNKIIDGNILKSDIEISKEEMFNFNFLEVVGNKEPHPPFYYIVLHTVQSLLADGKFSKWPGIVLNIFIYIFSSIFLYKLSKFFIKNELLSFLTVFLFAINTWAISSTVFIRMYEMFIMFTILIFYLFIKFIEQNHVDKKLLVKIGITSILGVMTHYHFVFFILPLFLVSIIYLYKKGDLLKIKSLFVSMVLSASLFFILWPYAFHQIFGSYHGMVLLGGV